MCGKLCFSIIVICLAESAVLGNPLSCHSDNKSFYPYIGTKTPYSYVYNDTGGTMTLTNCEPTQVWMLIRHGTRYPGESTIAQILNLTHIRDYIITNTVFETCASRYEKMDLKNWKPYPELVPGKGKYLAIQGEKDLASLAERIRAKLPMLFDWNVTKSFKLYSNCTSWKSRGINKEVKAFINGPEMTKVLANVSQRLGLLNISKEDIFLFYDACRFERTLDLDKPSPWCYVFTDDEMRVLEYEEDLFYYYNSGPGEEINSQLGCYLIRDMIDHFTKLEVNGDEPKGVFYFTHSQMMTLFFTAMGFAQNPVSLTATNFRDMDYRNWRISQLVPFAANFAAVLHRCNSSDAPFKVAFYLNENPLTIEGCKNGVCDWVQLKKKLGAIAANCSMEVCKKKLSGDFHCIMSALLVLLVASFLASPSVHVLARDVDFCFADEDDPYLYMATKTAYHFVHGGKTRFQTLPNCRPVQIWMLATHGTRCPTVQEIDKIVSLTELKEQILQNHEERKEGHMCNRDLDNLRRWRPDEYLLPQRAEILTPQGVEDMKLLARRLQSNFPELLQPNFHNITAANYKFRATEARNSMSSFMEGLFGTTTVLPEESSLNDTFLTAYKTCGVWKNEENEGSFENMERSRFDTGLEFQNLLRNVSRRIGFLYNISVDRIDAMYDACRYQKAWSVTELSPWCAVFSKEELRILEYREDLDYYYKAGYGRDINTRLGCPLLHDMMRHFWNVARDEMSGEPAGIFYFSDIISLQNLLTTMGINEDQARLTAYNYKEMARRQWRTSIISSFAANLIAVFYKCHDVNNRNKVIFYLGEKPVRYDGCQVGLCDWDFLKSKFGELASNCKLDVCWKANAATSSFPNSIAILLMCFIVLVRLGYRQL
ncbi:Multiple inositol polyphosphate phosphatase 1 [Trachymyrmex cornetzi]|uniref:Multiple inositol polyphosphate phosphatase 1 n=2 Tax=Trachymyrmex cornetzi TaxID=471704 RepID=A0A151IXB5_9HYME|nr:Multiple inositol polyphosphate phosphatase 1 [Trachymyrmex cornetzi]